MLPGRGGVTMLPGRCGVTRRLPIAMLPGKVGVTMGYQGKVGLLKGYHVTKERWLLGGYHVTRKRWGYEEEVGLPCCQGEVELLRDTNKAKIKVNIID